MVFAGALGEKKSERHLCTMQPPSLQIDKNGLMNLFCRRLWVRIPLDLCHVDLLLKWEKLFTCAGDDINSDEADLVATEHG